MYANMHAHRVRERRSMHREQKASSHTVVKDVINSSYTKAT